MDIPWYIILLAILGGGAAGFINTLAGSGSIITLPLLIFLGLPANVANGTNRLGALLQTAVSVVTFIKRGKFDLSGSFWLILPAVIGSLVGAYIAVDLDVKTMTYTIGAVMVLLLPFILTNRDQWLRKETIEKKAFNKGAIAFIFAAIGVYGGFVQSGVGIFLLSAMVLFANYALVQANVLKNVIVLCYTIPTFFIFMANDQINWELGLLVASGQMIGSWVAARFAMEHSGANKWIRYLLVFMILISAFELFGFREILISLF